MIVPILAIGKNTFQEAIRSKIFIICLVVLVILCAFAPMFPSVNDAHAKLKLALSVSLQLCYFFGMMIIIFTSAAFIPDEINSKRIYTIFPKPVSRFQYLLGKLLGICLLSFSLLLVFALMIIIFVRITFHALPESSQKESLSFFSAIDSYPIDSFKRYRKNKEVGEVPAHSFEVKYNNLSLAEFDGKLSIKLLAFFVNPNHPNQIYFDLDVIDEQTNSSIGKMQDIEVLDKKLATIILPKEMAFKENSNVIFKLKIAAQSQSFVGGVMILKSNFHFHKKPKLLETNVLRAFSLFAIQFILLGFIAVVASTRMSYYIATIFSITTFAAGSFTGFLKEYLSEKQEKIDLKVLDTSTVSSKFGHLMDQYMQAVCSLMPNFSKYDVSKDVIEGLMISNGRMIEVATHYSIFIAIYLFFGALMIWKREV